MKKQLLTILLVLAMVLSLVPGISVLANETENAEPVAVIENNNSGETSGDELTYDTVQAAVNAAKGIGPVTIKMRANSTENVTIYDDCEITLDLNGFVLQADTSENNTRARAISNYGKLTIIDSSCNKCHRVAHYFEYNPTGAWTYDGDCKPCVCYSAIAESLCDIDDNTQYVKIYGGCITGGQYYQYAVQTNFDEDHGNGGGGVYNGGTLSMSNITVCGNRANVHGGGVLNNSNKSNEFVNVTVCGNEAYNGGGVHNANYGNGITLTGCNVSYNHAQNGAWYENYGGGVLNAYSSTMTIDDCIISNNSAGTSGGVDNNGYLTIKGETKIEDNTSTSDFPSGGLYCYNQYCTSITIDGNVTIKNNTTNTTKANLCLSGDSIQLVNIIDVAGSNIGVSRLSGDDEHISEGQFTSNGVINDTQYFFSDSKLYCVKYNDSGYLELVPYATYCTYKTCLYAGDNLPLFLNEKAAGTFTIAGDACTGFTLKSEDQYLAYVNGEVKLQDTPFTWKYNGGLYTEVKSCGWFWCRPKTTNYYLDLNDEGNFEVSKHYVEAKVQVTANEHTIAYHHDGDGKHEAYCTKCAYEEDPETHVYDPTTHLCKCGKFDPEFCCISDVRVCEKEIKVTTGFWCWKKTVTKYQYTIIPMENSICAKTVQYSTDEKASWKTGRVLISDKKLSSFYIKVIDSNEKETNWVYNNGIVSPAAPPR